MIDFIAIIIMIMVIIFTIIMIPRKTHHYYQVKLPLETNFSDISFRLMAAKYLLSMKPVFTDITFYHEYAIIIRFSTDAVEFFLLTVRHIYNLDLY